MGEEQEINKKITNINISSVTYQSYVSDEIYEDICVSRLGRTVQVSNNDFLEYGTKFLIEKSDYNDKIVQNLFNDKTQSLVGSNIVDIEINSKAIFPTKTREESVDLPLDKYFGMTVTDDVKLVVLDVKTRNTKDRLVFKDSKGTELFKVLLESSFTYSSAGDLNKTLIYIIISNKNKITVNFAKTAWIDDVKNPLRNLKEFYLRRDELKALTSYINPITNIGNNRVLDSASGTLVGNEFNEKESLPIYNKKRELREINKWNKFTTYNYSDECLLGDTRWKSLTNQNKGNYPLLSQYWEKSENLSNYYTDRFIVDFENYNNLNLDSGNIYPSNEFAVFKDDKEVRIVVDTNPGISLEPSYISAIDESGKITQLTKDIDYTYSISQAYENLIVFKEAGLEALRSFEKLLLNITRLKLALNILFYKVDIDSTGNAKETSISESSLKQLLSLKYKNIVSEDIIDLNLGDDKEAGSVSTDTVIEALPDEDLVESEEGGNVIKIPDKNYCIYLNFTARQIQGNDYAAKTEDIITYDNYPSVYIKDELMIVEKSNQGYSDSEKTYLLDYVIDNKGHKHSFTDMNGERSAIIEISPESINEINSIITYKVYLTERKYNISIQPVGVFINTVIFENYQLTSNGSEPVYVRYYKTDEEINAYMYVNGTQLSLSGKSLEIKNVCGYQYLGSDNNGIFTIKFTDIKTDLNLICRNKQ